MNQQHCVGSAVLLAASVAHQGRVQARFYSVRIDACTAAAGMCAVLLSKQFPFSLFATFCLAHYAWILEYLLCESALTLAQSTLLWGCRALD